MVGQKFINKRFINSHGTENHVPIFRRVSQYAIFNILHCSYGIMELLIGGENYNLCKRLFPTNCVFNALHLNSCPSTPRYKTGILQLTTRPLLLGFRVPFVHYSYMVHANCSCTWIYSPYVVTLEISQVAKLGQ